MTHAGELAGDLAVLVEELEAVEQSSPPPADDRSTRRHDFIERYDRLFELAIATGLAAEHDPVPAEIRADLATHTWLLEHLWGELAYAMSYIGYSAGFFYSGMEWPEICRIRSALEFLRELAAGPGSLPAEVEYVMAHYGWEMFDAVELTVPEGMPARHWWWFRDSP